MNTLSYQCQDGNSVSLSYVGESIRLSVESIGWTTPVVLSPCDAIEVANKLYEFAKGPLCFKVFSVAGLDKLPGMGEFET